MTKKSVRIEKIMEGNIQFEKIKKKSLILIKWLKIFKFISMESKMVKLKKISKKPRN